MVLVAEDDGAGVRSASFWRDPIAGALGVSADEIILGSRVGGAPTLEVGGGPWGVSFTRRGGHRACAVAPGPVGVDLEIVEPLSDLDRVAARAFSLRELARWRALETPERLGAFYASWTCKEATLKAMSTGLSVDPQTVEIEPVGSEERAVRVGGTRVRARVAHRGSLVLAAAMIDPSACC